MISGVTFATNVAYPAAYNGALFFADHSRLCIWAMQPATAGGTPDPSRVVTMVNNAAGPVDLEIGPNGDVYYVDFDGGTIHELRAIGANRPPVAVAKANVTSGAAPLTVTFDGSASGDPDGSSLTYDWNFGDGTPHSTAVKPVHTFIAAGTFTVTLKVTDPQGASGTASLTINSSNHRARAHDRHACRQPALVGRPVDLVQRQRYRRRGRCGPRVAIVLDADHAPLHRARSGVVPHP